MEWMDHGDSRLATACWQLGMDDGANKTFPSKQPMIFSSRAPMRSDIPPSAFPVIQVTEGIIAGWSELGSVRILRVS
jgi:hypothetical protein